MLDETGPKPILDKFRGVKNLRILACGGDGTVGWVMNCLDELKFDPHPPVAVLPLGTGNDLARTLKWGAGYAGESLSNILNRVEMAQTINLDRWHVAVTPFAEDGTPITSKRTETIMNNYVSVGAFLWQKIWLGSQLTPWFQVLTHMSP
jgi:diacylglycerol kinase (ATP)